MSQPYLGEIVMFAGNFAPRNWALCEGQLLAINSNQALYSILGTTYGGDGRTSFGLPDLRGRIAMHPGQGPGLPTYSLGQKGGNYEHQLTTQQMPGHTHPLLNNAIETAPTQSDPSGNSLAEGGFYASGTPDARTQPATTGQAGGNQSYSIQNPYQAVNFIICIQGLFPPRN